MINVHASLLPALRGAAPIQWAIRNGNMETGVTIMQMEAGLDSGPMYLQRRTPIREDDTSATLAERLSRIGADALVETLALLGRGAIEPTPQEHALATLAPKIGRETARIAWDAPSAAIDCHVRAFDPAPGAWAVSNGAEVKLFGSSVVDHATTDRAGTVLAATGLLDAPGAVVSGSSTLTADSDATELVGASGRTLRGVHGSRIGFVFQDPGTSLNPLLTLERQITESLETHRRMSRHRRSRRFAR